MKRKDDVFRYLGQILIVFGFSMVFIGALGMCIGEDAKEYSTIFAMGSQGISFSTLLQFLMMSVLITTLRFILFTDGLICRISLTVRTFLMFFLVVLLAAFFAFWFGWFPVNMLEAWGGFFASFALCSFVSAYIMAWKTDRENREMEEALKRLKDEEQNIEE